jgi:oxygen-independent coproporphyrinogen III oxidase
MTSYQIPLANETLTISSELLTKYDKVGPRYTSYPTAPEWKTDFSTQSWTSAIERSNVAKRDLSLYFHIPFCQSACYYCACNIVVSPRSAVSEPYLEALKREIDFVGSQISSERQVKQLHFGGGTPTYLNLAQIADLFGKIKDSFNISFAHDSEISIEIDPRVTSYEQLNLLRSLGFNRVSLGVQDFNPKVQEAVNRIQSHQMVHDMLAHCRKIGFRSINFDLIYGLPFQTLESFKETLRQVIELAPDRIALFNYAHLPSLRPFQKANINDTDLPSRDTKLLIFCEAMKEFSANGYQFIGMDHFAKLDDELCKAQKERTLHRNFQGYTTKAGLDLVGMGMTSISSIDNIYAQNEKKLNRYNNFFSGPNISSVPLEKGLKLNPEDLLRRTVISKILCHGLLVFSELEGEFGLSSFKEHFKSELENLLEFEEDGLLKLDDNKIEVTSLGRIFLRNIAMVFDAYLKVNSNRLFSRTV